MLVTNSQCDPIVEILRLAYHRGLAVRQEQARQNSVAQAKNPSKEDVIKEKPVRTSSYGRDERPPFNHKAAIVEDTNDG